MAPVIDIVDERTQMHAVVGCEIFEQMIGADLVAFIRRIRNAVNQQEQVVHVQPRFLAIGGPIILVSANGSFFHILMNISYLGLVGLTLGSALALTRKYS